MRTRLRLYLLLPALLLLVAGRAKAQQTTKYQPVTKTVRFSFPLNTPHEGAVLGNGTQGLMVWGQGRTLNLSLAQGGFGFDADGELKQLAAGRLTFNLPENYTLEHVETNLLTATITVTISNPGGVDVPLRIHQSMAGNLIWAQLPPVLAKKVKYAFTGTKSLNTAALEHNKVSLDSALATTAGLSGVVEKCGNTNVAVLWKELAGTVYVATATSEADAALLVNKPNIKKIADSTTRYWANWWGTAARVRTEDGQVQQLYDYGCFKLACATAHGTLPVSQQGPWLEETALPALGGNALEPFWLNSITGNLLYLGKTEHAYKILEEAGQRAKKQSPMVNAEIALLRYKTAAFAADSNDYHNIYSGLHKAITGLGSPASGPAKVMETGLIRAAVKLASRVDSVNTMPASWKQTQAPAKEELIALFSNTDKKVQLLQTLNFALGADSGLSIYAPGALLLLPTNNELFATAQGLTTQANTNALFGFSDAALSVLHQWQDAFVNAGLGSLNNPVFTGLNGNGTYQNAGTKGTLNLEPHFTMLLAVHHLLLQRKGNTVYPCPVIPANWKDFRYEGLRASGGLQVSAYVQNAKMQLIKIYSAKGGTMQVAHNEGETYRQDEEKRNGPIATARLDAHETVELKALTARLKRLRVIDWNPPANKRIKPGPGY